MLAWLVLYEAGTTDVYVGDNASTRLDLDNEPQPDAILLLDPHKGGQARIGPDDYVEGAPELVAEIASSSVSYDLDVKLKVYRRSAVKEYIVWRVLDRQIDWFSLRDGQYERMSVDDAGLYKSEVFPGLWLDAAALVRGDIKTVVSAARSRSGKRRARWLPCPFAVTHPRVTVSSIMRELTALNAAEYLRDSGRVPAGASIDVRELTGGVSNIVLRADVSGRLPIVIKQCRERLRVAMEWHARLERIWTEQAAMELLGAILPAGTVPLVEFEDRPNYLFAMTCAPDDAVTWKSQLMAGTLDPDVAVRLGIILATIHDKAPALPALKGLLADASLFDELRVDPYYRTIARAHPDLKPRVDALIAAMDRPESERTLVLGDFSPKNILVHQAGVILLDFECAHAGDPAFDLGFFLTHLLLKRIRAEATNHSLALRYTELATLFLDAYLDLRALDATVRAGLICRAVLHTAACCLARVDGKSPVEYLDAQSQAVARSFARESLRTEPRTWDALLEQLNEAIKRTNACRP